MRTLVTLLFSLFISVAQASGVGVSPYEGSPLPDFTLTDMQGQAHTLSDYQGKVVMVNFWASYCGPCVKEIPSMERLAKLMGEEFIILAVNMAEAEEDINAFMAGHDIAVSFPILLDSDAEVLTAWMVNAVPATFLIDPAGTIRYSHFGGLEWDNDEVQGIIRQLQAGQ